MTQMSLLPQMALHDGMTFAELCYAILNISLRKYDKR